MKPTFDISKLIHSAPLLTDTDLHDLASPNTPSGFQTVPGWWAEVWSDALEIMDERERLPVFFNDAEKLQTICEERGRPFQWITAPPPIAHLGFPEVRAFPVELLAEFYPANP